MPQPSLPIPGNDRVFCTGRNDTDPIREMGNPEDSRRVIFMKPPRSLERPDEPGRLTRDRGRVHHEAELVVDLAGGASSARENGLPSSVLSWARTRET